MRLLRDSVGRRSVLLVLFTTAVLGAAAAVAYSAGALGTGNPTIYACVTKSTGAARIVVAPGACKSNEYLLTWNVTGPKGDPGPAAPSAVMQHQSWCGGFQCPEARWFTEADLDTDITIISVPRPDNGNPPWDQTVALSSMKWYNGGQVAVDVDCLVGQETLFATIPAGQHVELSGTTPYHVGSGIDENDHGKATVSCQLRAWQTGEVHLQLTSGSITLLPAGYMQTGY